MEFNYFWHAGGQRLGACHVKKLLKMIKWFCLQTTLKTVSVLPYQSLVVWMGSVVGIAVGHIKCCYEISSSCPEKGYKDIL